MHIQGHQSTQEKQISKQFNFWIYFTPSSPSVLIKYLAIVLVLLLGVVVQVAASSFIQSTICRIHMLIQKLFGSLLGM